MSDNTKLFSEFPPISTSDWEKKINTDLKGGDYNKKLVWKTIEGFDVRPYYRNENLNSLGYLDQIHNDLALTGEKNNNINKWYIRQDIIVDDIEQSNRKALDILNKGVTSIGFIIKNKEVLNPVNFEKLLNGICLSAIEINFICERMEADLASIFKDYIIKKGYNPISIIGSINLDTVGHLVKYGRFSIDSPAQALDYVSKVIAQFNTFPNYRTITIHGSYFTNSGSSIVQSLAFSLSVGADYMTWLTDAGLKALDVANCIKFNFAISSDYFNEIAHLRAARLLWAKIIESYDGNCKSTMNIHAETGSWNKSVYDPYVNVLRCTTEAMSAALGGINSLTVLPFDLTFEKPTDLAERVARNTQIILQEESYFDKIIDPSAGSYYIENLTDCIVTATWKLFLEVQEKGGFVTAFRDGFIQSHIKDLAARRKNAIATRREILLGTNQFPDFNEIIDHEISDLSYESYIENQSRDIKDEKVIAEPLIFFRGGENFETLRLITDKSGKRPKVFMLPIGNVAKRKARATFACNFFACAGFQVIDNDGFSNADEGIKEALRGKADIIVICSSDDEYASLASDAFIKLDNRAIFVVAGDPVCKPDLEAKGIKNFISVKSDVLGELQRYQRLLGISV